MPRRAYTGERVANGRPTGRVPPHVDIQGSISSLAGLQQTV
jgi:hypothetical protein